MQILIVEDEHIIAARLSRLLSDILGDRLTQLDVVTTLAKAESFLEQTSVDLVFLDLNLRGKSGFELLRKAVAGAYQTIIVSAHTERAMEAFEYGVLDFVGKPFDKARLEVSIERFLCGTRPAAPTTRYLAVKQASGTVLVGLDEVAYIRGAGAYGELVLHDGRTLLHSKSLEKLERLLPNRWQRIHKSYLADMAQVRQWLASPGSKYEIELKDGTRLPVGRTRYKELRTQWL